MSLLLDTNVVSALRRKNRLPARALSWLQEQLVDELYISALTMMEIEIGIRRLARHDAKQAEMLRAWKEGPLRREFRGRILSVDLEIAERARRSTFPTRSRKSTL